MNKRTIRVAAKQTGSPLVSEAKWETYVYVPSQERLEERFDTCLYEINWIWHEQFRNQDLRFEDELPAIWKRLENIKEALREHYGVAIKTEITIKRKME